MADSAATTILKEYLLSLGFTVDERGAKRAQGALNRMEFDTSRLGKAIVGVATATTAMVTVFAYQMEKLYYASKRTDSAVGSIQAMEYGAKQIGISGDAIKGSLESMARSIRSNPGLLGLLNSLGVKVEGRDKADVLMDLVAQLKKMPFYVAERYAALFGIDADTLFMMQQGLDKMREAANARKQMAAEAGVDTEAAAKAAMEYSNIMGELSERAGILEDAVMLALLPSFREFAGVLREVLNDWTKIANNWKGWDDFMTRFTEGWLNKAIGPRVELSPEAKRALKENEDALKQFDNDFKSKKAPGAGQNGPGASNATPVGGGPQQDRLRSLERQYALPAGWLDRVWKQESNRGDPRFMTSGAGAQGHFQFMPGTAKQYGLKDPNDFNQSSEAAARYYADLFKKYQGDAAKAAAAYNWGPGNVDRYGLGRAPRETRDYVNSVAGVQIEQNNTITVTGVSNPAEVGRQVETAQRNVNSDLIRQFKPRVQ